MNGLAFLLIGLELPFVLRDLQGYEAGAVVGLAAAVCVTVVVVRLAWIYPATYLPRWLFPSIARRDPAPPPRVPLVLGWGGMRGAVTLAAALALPLQTEAGEPLPGRGLVIFLAFTVIAANFIMDIFNFILDPRVRTG